MYNLLATAPLDVTAGGTEIAGYVGAAALAGFGIAIALYAVRTIVRAFKTPK
jgi:hypothetical protein